MRRLVTCALSCVISAALSSNAQAATSLSAQPKLATTAPAIASSGIPLVSSVESAIDMPEQTVAAAPLDTTASQPAPSTATLPVKKIAAVQKVAPKVVLQIPATKVVSKILAPTVVAARPAPLDSVGNESGAAVNGSAGPVSPMSDLMMWGLPTAAASASHEARVLSSHAAAGIQRLTDGILDRTRSIVARITDSAMRFIGTPYSFGGTTASGFDCSGYVQHIFALVGISLPRTADAQYLVGEHINPAQAKRGDLVFFQTYTSGVSHVGIYLGNDQFIHSSSSRGVSVSSLHDRYWAARFIGAERILGGNHVVGTVPVTLSQN